MRRTLFPLLTSAVLSVCSLCLAQGGPRLTVDATAPISTVSPTLYGLMTEEINYSYDGGLYPELLRNPTAQHSWQGFEHWRLIEHGSGHAEMTQSPDGPSAALPRGLRTVLTGNTADHEAGIANEGYWGMAVRSRSSYDGSFFAKTATPNVAHARFVADNTGAVLAEAELELKAGGWDRYGYSLTPTTGAPAGSVAHHFELVFDHPGTIDLQLLSLRSPAYHNRPDGLRADLMEKMSAMHPRFLRLPGGNYLEGDTIAERFEWKKTLGPRVDRPGHRSPWGYDSTDGLGLLEFLEWCEDLHIEPVLAVYAGFSLKGEHVTGAELTPFVQDDLDEIEFVTGDRGTKWGAARARDGHPEPFPLHYVEIGNEDEFDKSGSYNGRFSQISAAIRARYPQLKLIATTPVTAGTPDLIDDHYYRSPEEFFAMVHRYDTADRSGPKVFVGEWATREGSPTPDFGAALGDAAWMTGMERNSDLILLSSYAPLFVNVNPGGMQWSSDLIGYDAATSYGSPSYWAQALFASHLGDHTVRTSAAAVGDRFFWSATASAATKMLHLKLVNASDLPLPLVLDLHGVKTGPAEAFTMTAESTWATNTLRDPEHIVPRESTLRVSPGNWQHNLPARTIEVVEIPIK